MKKFLACLITICCLFSFVTLTATAAEECGKIATLEISTDTACGGLQGALDYTELENVTFKSAAVNANIEEYNSVKSSVLDSNSKTRFALVGDVENGTSGNWLTVKYNCLSSEKIDFKEKSFKVYDVNGVLDENVNIEKNLSETKVYIGDANEDGKLDIRDLVEMDNCKDSEIEDELKNKCLDFDKNTSWDFATDMPEFRKYLLRN